MLGLNLGLALTDNRNHGIGGPSLPLDSLTSAVAYSIRKIRTAYTGNAVRVRRSSDNAEQDIGFTPQGNLDTTELQSFVGASNGFVTTWYDQSGNERNVTQATADSQPRIVNVGVIETAGAYPAIVHDGVDDGLVATSWGNVAQPFTRSMVIRTPSVIVSPRHITNSATGSPNVPEYFPTTTTMAMFAGVRAADQVVVPNGRFVWGSVYNTTNSYSVKNGTASSLGDPGANAFAGVRLGGFNGSSAFSATTFQEFAVFQSELSTSDRQALETNQMDYYNITP